MTVSIRKFRIFVLVSNWIEYWSNDSIQNFEYSHITNTHLSHAKPLILHTTYSIHNIMDCDCDYINYQYLECCGPSSFMHLLVLQKKTNPFVSELLGIHCFKPTSGINVKELTFFKDQYPLLQISSKIANCKCRFLSKMINFMSLFVFRSKWISCILICFQLHFHYDLWQCLDIRKLIVCCWLSGDGNRHLS